MKIICSLLSLLIPLHLLALSYDSSLLQIGGKLFPKVLFIEKGTKNRIQDSINLVIATSSSNQEHAKRLVHIIQNHYPNGINNHPFKFSIISIKEAQTLKSGHAIILMTDHEDPYLNALIHNANANQILTFSFDPELLENGTAISLYIGKSVKPYLNLSTLKNAPFSFDYGFLQLSVPYND